MKRKSTQPGFSAAMSKVAGFSLAFLMSAPAAWSQAPQLIKVDGSSTVNRTDGLATSWGALSYFSTHMIQATARAAPRVGTSVSTVAKAILITNSGAGYLTPPTVTIAAPPAGGTQATATAVLTDDGRVDRIVVVNAGSGYTADPAVTMTPPAPGGVGSTVHFNNDITANNLIELNGNRTVGNMILGDLSSTQIYTIASGTNGSLIFDSEDRAGSAYLNKFMGGNDVISAPVVLNDQLNVRHTTARLTLSGKISGGKTLTSYGNGVLSITGNNTGAGGTAPDYTLWLWNKGQGNANAQVELGSTTGNAAGNIIVGNASWGTSGHAVLQLLQGRSNLDQIHDGSTVTFDSYQGSGRNNYFKLMGGNETIGRILDLGSLAVIENREGEAVTTAARLTLSGNQDSYVSGFIRDSTGSNLQQADLDGTAGTRGLALTKNGTGTLTLTGSNIIFTGGMTVGAGKLVLSQALNATTVAAMNFRSNITNSGTVVFDTGTGTWNFQKTFADPDGTGPERAPAIQFLTVTGSGSVEKIGTGTLSLIGNQNIGGSLTVNNGILNFQGSGVSGSVIGNGLVVKGDSGLNRTVNLLGKTSITGGINAIGRFNNTGSSISVKGTVFNTGDQETSFFEDGVATVNGAIKLNYVDLRLESNFSIAKTAASSSSSTTLTVTNSASIVPGMRVLNNGVEIGTVASIDPVTRVVTLNQAASVSANAALTFQMARNSDGVITGSPSSLTLVGRPNAVGGALNAGGLYMVNTRFSNNTNRFPDATPITSKGGVIEFSNDATNNVFSENLGGLTLNQGNLQVVGYQSGATGSSTLTFNSLTRNAGSTVEFAGRDLSSGAAVTATNNLGTNNRNKIIITGGVTMDDGIIGGWAYANNEFVKYAANGVTRLLEADYQTGVPTTWTPTDNVKVGISANPAAVATRTAINSLNIQVDPAIVASQPGRTLTLNSGVILSIESGGLLASNGSHTINGGILTVGTAANAPAELIAIIGTNSGSTNSSALTINSPIRDFSSPAITAAASAGATKLTLQVVTTPIISPGAKGLVKGMLVVHPNIPAGTTILDINYATNEVTLSNPVTTAIAANAQLTFTGGQVGLTKSGPGTLVLTKDQENMYSGPTVVNNGILRIRNQTNFGTAPASFVANQLQINGGTLQFGNDSITVAPITYPAADINYSISDGKRGVTVGEAGGRIEVGHQNPNPGVNPAPENTPNPVNPIPKVNLSITNPIHADGVLELAVRNNASAVGGEVFNTLVLGTASSTNYYGGGIKTEGSFGGIITINGQNYINGFFMEGGLVTMPHNNNFSGPIRILDGTLTLNGSNTYNGTPNFSETITIGGATVVMGSNTALGTAGIKVSMADGARLVLNGTNQKLLSFTDINTSTTPTSTAVITNGSTSPSQLTVDLSVNEIYRGLLDNGGSSPLSLTKTGPGRLTLNNNSSDFTGNVRIENGGIDITSINFAGGESALGKGATGKAPEIVISNSFLSFSPRGQQFTDRSFTMGAGANAATLVANGINQAARVILGADFIFDEGTIFEERFVSEAVGFEGNGARTLTLSGVNIGDNEFQLQLSDKSASEPTSLLKTGPGTWALGTAGSFTGQTTVQEGVLAILANDVLGSTSISTTVNAIANTFTSVGTLPNGVEVTFPRLTTTVLPNGILPNTRYYVVNSTATTFQVSTTRGGGVQDITSVGENVTYIPNIQAVASTICNPDNETFTGNLPNGTAVVFNTQIQQRPQGSGGAVPAVLPPGINAYQTYFVIDSNGTTFRVSESIGGTVQPFGPSTGNIYYTAYGVGNTSSGINVIGGRLELRNVDYITQETVNFQGGALSVPANTQARWAGNFDIQANATFTVGANSELILDGNLLGNRPITQLGEGTIRLRGETIVPTLPGSPTNELDNSRRSYTLQAGTLVLDYGVNNNSKLVDTATLVLGGGRRGGVLRLQNGTHEEVVGALSLQAGANQIFRDSGNSSIRLNTISRAEGASLYFDLARIATVDNLNTNNILGGWAVIRDALVHASWTLYGTVSRTFTANPDTDVLSVPLAQGIHYLLNGTPVRLTTTGTLPAPLITGKTYYVTSGGTRTFKLAETLNGTPIDLVDAGSAGAQHTVQVFSTTQRQGPATLVFTAHQDNYPGDKGNNIFRIEIERVSTPGAITSQVSGPSQPTVGNPRIYKIITTSTVSSANAIVSFVNSDFNAIDYFSVTQSGSDTAADAGSYGPTLLNGGANDSGNQQLGWARNSTNSLDGLVQPTTSYVTNIWGRNANTNVTDNFTRVDGSITYTVRFATNVGAGIELLGDDPGSVHTLQTGAILVTPTVGANDSTIYGPGRLTTDNEGNLRNFVVHQYNEKGDLVIGVPLIDRAAIVRSGRLTGSADNTHQRLLSGLARTDDLQVGAQVFGGANLTVGGGILAGTTISAILDRHTVLLSIATNGGDVRNEVTFVVAGNQIRRLASQQGSGTQNRILGVNKPDGLGGSIVSTSDIYIGMPLSGPGIPAGTTVSSILNDSDIQVSTNHFFNGIVSTFTLTPSIGLEKLGGGTLILSGQNTYTGVSFLADGVLRATSLTDGGVAGSLGASTNAAANLNFNGGSLQYVGESSATNRNFTITDFAQINIGHEKTTSIFSGSITTSGTIGATDRLEKTGSGTLEMRGQAGLNEISVLEGKLRIQTVDLNAAPGTFSPSNFGQTGLSAVRLGGGILEVRGTEEGNISQTFGGSLYVDEGASEVRAVSLYGYDPNNLSLGKIARTTTINLMGGEEAASVIRSSGGSVRFVEAPEANAGAANIVLNTFTFDRAQVLPWAVYENLTMIARPGVNDFASISLANAGVVSADSQSLYDLGDFFMNGNNWGTEEPGSSIDASEGGQIQVDFSTGVTVTAESNEMVFSATLSSQMGSILEDMSVFGPGLPSGTRVVSVDIANLKVILNKAATTSASDVAYVFLKDRTFFGTLAGSREVNTLRYFSDDDSTVTVSAGSTLKLVAGAILVGANVHGGNKSIVGPGNITSNGIAGEGTDLIVHNYNANGLFTIGANIVDNIVVLQTFVGGTGSGAGTVIAGKKTLNVATGAFEVINRIHPGMEITGPGLEAGTFVDEVDKTRSQILMTKAATQQHVNAIYTFRSRTSFVQNGIGTTAVSGNNTYTGNTFVHGGVLRLDSANAVPGGITSAAPLASSSHIIVKDGVLGLGLGDFTRSLGTATNQIEFKGSGGFAAYGADRTVNFGGEGSRLRFGNDGFVADGSSLILGAHDATHKLTMLNPIDLGSFSQAVRVDNGPAEIEGELAGSLYGAGRLIKFGLGTLRLSAQNKHTGGIEIADGRLVVANVQDSLGTGSGLVRLGTSSTNTSKNAAIELSLEGGNVSNDLKIGGINSRGQEWVPRGTTDSAVANTGSHASMAVVNGNPAFAYYDSTNEDLKYVRAADPRGASWLPPVTLASRGNVGLYPSLAIINGNPAVSYYDATNGTLCFIRSSDTSGVFWTAPTIADSAPVNAIGVQSEGQVIIGGTFTEFDGVARTRIARLSSTGGLDESFTATVNGEVRAIVVQANDKIIIAGAFTDVRGTERNNIARLNADGTLDTSYNPNANGAIRTLLLQPNGDVLIGGAFTSISGVGRNRIARLTEAGAATSFSVNVDNEVFAVAVEPDGDVVFGGSFTVVNSNTRNRIARVDSAGVLQAFNPNANSDVRGIVIAPDNKVYIGGLFSTLGSFTRNRLARLNEDGNLDRDYGVEVNAEVRGMYKLSTGKILLRGIFTGVGDAAINSLACLNADGSVDTAFMANPDYEVRALHEQTNGKLLVGGVFSNIGGDTQHWAGRLNADGTHDTSFARKVDDRGQYTSMISANGIPAIAYYDVAKQDLRYIRSTDVNGANGTWVQSLILDSVGDVGRGTSMKVANIGGDLITKNFSNSTATVSGIATIGTPAIAYYDASNGDLKYVLGNNATGTDWSSPVTLQSTGDVGSHVSLELVNGFPAVAFYNATNGSLQYLRSKNAAGLVHNLRNPDGTVRTRALNLLVFSSNQLAEIDPATPAVWGTGGNGGAQGTAVTLDAGGVGQFPSLAVVNGQPTTLLGTPAVAYYAVTAGDLKYIRATDAEGAAWPSSATTIQSAGNVGRNAALVMTDGVAGIGYQDVTAGNMKFIHLTDASGYSKVAFTGDTTWNGAVNLEGNTLFAPEAGQTATINGAISGPGGFRLISSGTLVINSSNNTFGTATGSSQAAPVVIRSGSLNVGSNGALGSSVVALGDIVGNPAVTPPIVVRRATNGASLISRGGRFDKDHNGLFGSAGGPGAFVEVDTTIDGYTYSEGDVGKLILVKDEGNNPEWNGVYQIIFSSGSQVDGTMNLVRAASMDALAEFKYGTQVQILDGTYAGKAYFLSSHVSDVNASPVHWVQDALNGDLAFRANVSGLTIGNAIDVYSRLGAGSMTLGAADAVTSGTVNFSGNVVYRNALPDGNDADLLPDAQSLNLHSNIATGSGVTFSGNISQAGGAGPLKLVKTGTGVVTLSHNSNSFTGGVDVNAGTLLVMNPNPELVGNSATGSGPVTVNASAVLGGTGRIGGSVDLIGTGNSAGTRAILRPGDPNSTSQPVETLTITGSVNVGPNAVVEFTLGANNYTRLAANAVNVTPTGRLLVALAAGYTPAVGTEFDILDLATASSLTFTAGNVVLSEYLKLPGQYSWDTSLFLTQGKIKITGETTGVSINPITSNPSPAVVNPGIATTVSFTATVTGTPDFLYQWQKSVNGVDFENVGPEVRSTQTTNTFTLNGVFEANQASYRVVVSNGEGAFTATSNAIFLEVNDPPVVVQHPAPQTVNPGATATFTVEVSGPGPYGFQWKRGLTNIPNDPRYVVSFPTATTSQLTITNVQESDQNENYNVVVSNLAGAAPASNAAALSVNDPVGFTSHPSNATVSNGDPAVFNVVVSGTGPFTYQWQRDSGSGFVTVTDSDGVDSKLTLPAVTEDDTGDTVRVIVTNSVGQVTSNVAVLTVQPGAPSILEAPDSKTIAAGTTLELSVKVGGAQSGRVLQWKRNNGAVRLGANVIGGVTSNITVTEVPDGTAVISTLRITNISTGLAGNYTVDAKNVNVTKPVSTPAGTGQIAVASDPHTELVVKAGAKASLTVTAVTPPKGPVLTYRWKKNGVELVESDKYKGVTTKTLAVNAVTTDDSATYNCLVTGPGVAPDNAVNAGTQYLKVTTLVPELVYPIIFADAMVGAQFDHKIALSTDSQKAPVTVTATGLPPGLKVVKKGSADEAQRGWWISGIPTQPNKKDSSGAETGYKVKITATNTSGKVSTLTAGTAPVGEQNKVDPVLNVRKIPEGAVGIFAGWLPRHALNGEVGGRFDMTTTATGTFTGKITLGAMVHAFKGILDIDATETELPTATVTVARTGKPVPPPLTLTFTLDTNTNLVSGSITDGIVASALPVNGWRNKWSKLLPATAYMNTQGTPEATDDKPGYYTMALQPPTGPQYSAEDLPQGDSYISFNVALDGKLTLAGKTADNQAITGAQFVGPTGQVIVFQTLYKTTPKGSLVGQFNINKVNDAAFSDNTITTSPATAPTWTCPPNLLTSNRQYRDGFGPIALSAIGGAYVDPTPTGALILGLASPPTPDNAELTFSLDGLAVKFGDPSLPYTNDPSTPADDSTDAIDVLAANKLLLPVTPTATKLTVVPKTGYFSGSFTSKEFDPVFGSGNPKEVKRPGTFQGLLVKTGNGQQRGMGFFLLPKYPAVLGETVQKTQLLSNQVLLSPSN